jgi:solute carrier family 25 folate transporter 32
LNFTDLADISRRKINLFATGKALVQVGKQYGLRGLYQGLGPNVVGATLSWGLYFGWYTQIKELRAQSSAQGMQLTPTDHLISATQAGNTVGSLVTIFLRLYHFQSCAVVAL